MRTHLHSLLTHSPPTLHQSEPRESHADNQSLFLKPVSPERAPPLALTVTSQSLRGKKLYLTQLMVECIGVTQIQSGAIPFRDTAAFRNHAQTAAERTLSTPEQPGKRTTTQFFRHQRRELRGWKPG